MFEAFAKLFAMFGRLFDAGYKAAGAIDNLAGWAEESSGAFVDAARLEREAKLKDMQYQLSKMPKVDTTEAN